MEGLFQSLSRFLESSVKLDDEGGEKAMARWFNVERDEVVFCYSLLSL